MGLVVTVSLGACDSKNQSSASSQAPPSTPLVDTASPLAVGSAPVVTSAASTTIMSNAGSGTGAAGAGHQQGAALYAKYCQLCHAPDGTGYAADNAPSLVSDSFLRGASDEFIAAAIRLGRPDTAMAAYGTVRGGPMNDAQIRQLVSYLRSLGPAHGSLDEKAVTGNPQRGLGIYVAQCQSCHGADNERGKAPSLHNREFLAAATPGFLRHAIIEGRPPTPMQPFAGRLTPGQIEDVVAYLRSLAPPPTTRESLAAQVPDDLPLVINPQGKHPSFTLRDKRFVSAAQVKRALAEKRRLVLVDARSPADWLLFHIPGSVPIPYYDTKRLSQIPKDDTWVVAYCACPHHASGEVVDALRRQGYKNTAVLDEGILYWKDHGFPLDGRDVMRKGKPAKP